MGNEQIAILGTGNMGSALARTLSSAGYKVFLGSRETRRAAETAARLQQAPPAGEILSGTYLQAIQPATTVILTCPFPECAAILTNLHSELAGKTLVDITNPFGAVPPDTSGAEQNAKLLPPNTPVVAAWKTNFWNLFDPAVRGDAVHDVFLCANEEEAKARIAALVTSTGFRPIDAGKLQNARVLDAMVPLMLEIDDRYGHQFTAGWKFVP